MIICKESPFFANQWEAMITGRRQKLLSYLPKQQRPLIISTVEKLLDGEVVPGRD